MFLRASPFRWNAYRSKFFFSTVATFPLQGPYSYVWLPLNDKTGGSAQKWTNSKPVRVVRNYKGRKSSSTPPEERNKVDLRWDLQGSQVLAREKQERIHCLEVPVQERYEVRGCMCCVSSYHIASIFIVYLCIGFIFRGYKLLRLDR